ncbi:chromate transporter [Ammoniphilus sp. CFH 90114]|uniref:chromate transporter n=1 Tax=Ammoniphilus sp. CFH 90114 TaxID=2493665 RepID=UPI00100EAF5F|nr:chromate transporter [Ammoniphilus sp. CFH 90114]RXT08758.1 chromate transporter [Ammoniphilus sp. CFH 90114]
MLKSYGELFIGFFRAGMLGYGGGPSSIPLFHKEAVDKFKWVSDEEFGNILAIANTLPGPIVTKLAGYIGYRVAGVLGLLISVLATVVPTVLLMGLLLGSLYSIKDASWVVGMTTAIQPVIGVMMFVLAYDFIKKSWKGEGRILTLSLVAASIIALQLLGIHPALIIGVLLAYALLWGRKNKQQVEQQPEQKEAANK